MTIHMRMKARLISLFTEFLDLLWANLKAVILVVRVVIIKHSTTPDASEDLDIEKNKRKDRNETGEEQSEPVDIEPEIKKQNQNN